VVTGNLALSEPGRYTANVAITDRQSAIVVAQSAVRFRDSTLSDAPTRFYNDSPSVGRDRSIDGLVATSETPAGKAADALYIEQLPTSALLAEGLTAYNTGRWEDALKFYTAAAARVDGQQLRTFNGLYLANIRLGRSAPAEDAFGKIATLGLATNNLAVKLLFRTGTTEFLQGSDLSGVYPMWIRQIARAAQASRTCLNIVGHTSKTGSEAVNDKLSVSRGEAVRSLLEREAKGLAGQLRASGVGFRENLVGTGTDDARDAVDRRVEFKVVPCGK
jgi:outer membrane protein OmpA-like peptidoglycan-associated protein